jgi:hypothetical protein
MGRRHPNNPSRSNNPSCRSQQTRQSSKALVSIGRQPTEGYGGDRNIGEYGCARNTTAGIFTDDRLAISVIRLLPKTAFARQV